MRDLMREEMGAIGHYPTAPVRLADKAVALGAKGAGRLTDADGSSPPPLTLVESLQHFVLDKLVLSKVRDKLGGLLFANGGAALSGGLPLGDNRPLASRSSPSTGSPSPGREGRVRGHARAYLFEPAAAVEGCSAHGAELKALLADEIAAHSSGFKNFELPEKFAIL
ncbi:decanoate-CoA ligase [Aureococcus anophagefferens]|nr:decanoate-CoA ligase [Aureococcus anophagefferens]